MPKTVLIVEDNELNMKLFNDLVETRGHHIVQTRERPRGRRARAQI